MNNKSNHVVVDIETLGNKPGCVILQIGAADILQRQPPFSAPLKIQPQINFGFGTDENTLIWWEKHKSPQNAHAWGEEYDPIEGLELFSSYLKSLALEGPPLAGVWGNSSIFDLGILAHTYHKYGLLTPWNYKQEFCFRTIKFLLAPDYYIEGIVHAADIDASVESVWLRQALDDIQTKFFNNKQAANANS